MWPGTMLQEHRWFSSKFMKLLHELISYDSKIAFFIHGAIKKMDH
jgi:hypothetical protein